MSRNALLGICLGISLGIVGCQNETTEPATSNEAPSLALTATTHHLRLNPAAFPASLRDRVISSEHVIDPEAYKCRQTTTVGNWFNSQVNRIPHAELVRLIELGATDVPLVDGIVFEPLGTQEFGYNGAFNTVMQNTQQSVKNFWNFTTPDVLLGAMKGSVVLDTLRVAVIYRNFFIEGVDANGNPIPVTSDSARSYARQLRSLALNTNALNAGDHPIFSFNAFAIPTAFTAQKIIMGDGVLEGLAAVGLGNIAALAPQAVYAHEFGHQIQFKNGYDAEAIPGQNKETSAAELTRYTELMADAYSGYYLAHQNLGKTDKQQIRDAERAFFNLGDCAFDQAGHHGTPDQRQASVDFGIETAARDGGTILTQQQFHDLFFAKYPELIAADQPQASR